MSYCANKVSQSVSQSYLATAVRAIHTRGAEEAVHKR